MTGRDDNAEAPGGIPAGVREAARAGEPDRWIALTLAPAPARPGLAVLAAFAAELARIPATVSEAMLGDIRLQWWRDALAAGRKGELSGNPIADELDRAIRRDGLEAAALEAMIDARELDLSGGLVEDDAGLASYLGQTEGNLFRLGLSVLGVAPAAAAEIAGPAGRAYGLARSLGRLPGLIHNGGVPVPAARLRAHGLDPARLADRPPTAETAIAAAEVLAELRQMARRDLAEVRRLWPGLAAGQRAALLPLAMVEPYFRAQSDRQLLTEIAPVTPLRRVWSIGLAHFSGRL